MRPAFVGLFGIELAVSDGEHTGLYMRIEMIAGNRHDRSGRVGHIKRMHILLAVIVIHRGTETRNVLHINIRDVHDAIVHLLRQKFNGHVLAAVALLILNGRLRELIRILSHQKPGWFRRLGGHLGTL